MTSTGRVARLTALALATGTLVAAGAGTAGAASQSTTTTFTANGGGQAVSLALHLPAAVPTLGDTITQDLIATASNVRTSSPTVPAAAVTTAVLGANGNVPVVSAALNKSITAEFGKTQPASQGAFPANPLLTGGVLNLSSATSDPDAQGAAPVAHSVSSVAELKVDGSLGLQKALDQLAKQVQAQLDGVIGTLPNGQDAPTVAGVSQPVTDLLGQVTSQLPALAGNDLNQASKDALNRVITLLDSLPQSIAGRLSAKLSAPDTSLVHVGLITSEQEITHNGGVVTSHASNALERVSLLGGMVTLDSLTSDAVAALGDGAQAPTATGTASILKLHLATLLDAEITGELQAIISSGTLPAAVTDAVQGALNTVLATLKGALNGTGVVPASYSHSATADKATAAASPVTIRVALLGTPIIELGLMQAKAEVSRVKAQAETAPVYLPTNGVSQNVARPQFAHTGANFGLTAPLAIALMGLGAVARRRRQALEG